MKIKKLFILCFIVLSCSANERQASTTVKEIEYNGDNENAQYIDKSITIKAVLDNSKEERDIDIYRLVCSNDYILSLSIKQNKNVDLQISVENLNKREIFSMVKNNNIKVPLYNIKDNDIFLKIESSNSSEKVGYSLKIDFIDDYYNDKEVEPNNTFADAINILSPDYPIEGSFVNIYNNDRIPNQIVTNTSFSTITDTDIYRLRNSIDTDIDAEIILETKAKTEILLFDSSGNLLSKYTSNNIPIKLKKTTTYYIALVYYSEVNKEESYKIYYKVKD